MGLLLFYVLLALGVSFLCSVMEAVLLTLTPSYIAMQEAQRPALGRRLKMLKDDVDRPLAAILSLNTIAHTIGAAGAGAQAAVVFKSLSVATFSGILTLLMLVGSEIIPKTIGTLYWQSLAPAVSRLLQLLVFLMWPLVKISEGITWLLSRGEKQATISRAELSAIADLVEKEGILAETESNLMKNILRFRSLTAQDVMTPRPVLFTLQQDLSVRDVLKAHPELRFSRIPIYNKDRDDIEGYILKDELLRSAAEDENRSLKQLKRPITILPNTSPLLKAFDTLIQKSEHIALVVDAYGGVAGVLTMEDIIETMLGIEIVDEADSVEDMQALARQRWRARAQKLGLELPEE